jgi:hypothetical protein
MDTTKMAFAGNNDSSTDLRVLQGEAFQWFREQLAALQDHVVLRAAYQPPGMRQLKSPAPRE